MKGMSFNDSCLSCHLSCLENIFSEHDKKLIDNNRSELVLAAGDTIVRQGNFVSQVIYLKEGIVKKVLEGKNDRNTIVKIVYDKNFLALPILGNSNQYPFSLTALSTCHLCIIKKETLYSIMRNNNDAFDFIMKWYSYDYIHMYNKIATISTRNSHGKLASALLYLTDNDFRTDILNIISRKELSELSSISKESTNKILQQLNHDGIIEINKDKIEVKRRDLLEKLSTVG